MNKEKKLEKILKSLPKEDRLEFLDKYLDDDEKEELSKEEQEKKEKEETEKEEQETKKEKKEPKKDKDEDKKKDEPDYLELFKKLDEKYQTEIDSLKETIKKSKSFGAQPKVEQYGDGKSFDDIFAKLK